MNEHLGSELQASQPIRCQRTKRNSRSETERWANGVEVLISTAKYRRINRAGYHAIGRIFRVNLTSNPRGCHNGIVIDAVEGIRGLNQIDGAVDEDQQWVGEMLNMVRRQKGRTITTSEGCCRFINTLLSIWLIMFLTICEQIFNLKWLLNRRLRLPHGYTGVYSKPLHIPLKSELASSIVPDWQTMHKKNYHNFSWTWEPDATAPHKPGRTKLANVSL